MKSILILAASAAIICSASLEPSNLPPADLPVENTPLFIFLGSDDNFGHGMPYLLDYFSDKVNPSGIGQAATFDGDPVRISFYSNTSYMYSNTWMGWHKRALDDGHELGLHTHGHPHVASTEQAIEEIARNREEFGRGVETWGDDEAITFPPETFTGFRAPYLDVSNHVFKALDSLGLRYDCSLEDGMAPGIGVEDFNWPYTMDSGMTEGWKYLYEFGKVRDTAESHPGIWEIPAYPVFFIPESLYVEYGLDESYNNGKRDTDNWGFGEINESEDALKMTGLDYDAWYVQKWSGHEFAMTLLYNLKLRLETNRVPLAFGIHSQYYDQEEWLNGLKTFVDTALTFADVRFVTGNELIDWMENPVGLDGTVGGSVGNISDKHNNRYGIETKISLSGRLLEVGLNSFEKADFTVYSLNGRAVERGVLSQNRKINLSSVSAGVYILKLNIDGIVTTNNILLK